MYERIARRMRGSYRMSRHRIGNQPAPRGRARRLGDYLQASKSTIPMKVTMASLMKHHAIRIRYLHI